MKKVFLLSCLFAAQFLTNAQHPTIGKIHRLDPELDSIIDTTAQIEIIAQGFVWSEGPVWVKKEGYLLFTDVPKNVIHKWSTAKGLEVFLQNAGFKDTSYSKESGANGLIINQKGNLVACEHGNRRVSEMPLQQSNKKKNLAHLFEGKQLNSPNDIVQAKSGDYYFTDPPFGMPKRGIDDAAKELPFQGVYRIDKKGTLSLQIKDIFRPNGLTFNPNQNILYVASSDAKEPYIYAYPVEKDGNLGEKRIFYDKAGSDGMKIDKEGHVFITCRFPANGAVHGDVLILNASGKLIGRIETGNRNSNLAFGEDGKTLFITSTGNLLRVRLKSSGF